MPFALVPTYLIDAIGRQLSTCFFMGIGGIVCIAMGPVSYYGSDKGSEFYDFSEAYIIIYDKT